VSQEKPTGHADAIEAVADGLPVGEAVEEAVAHIDTVADTEEVNG
jgi:hypothetical protein